MAGVGDLIGQSVWDSEGVWVGQVVDVRMARNRKANFGMQQQFTVSGLVVSHRRAPVMLGLTVSLVALAAVNAIVVTWATALDAKHSSALARALGATPRQVSTGLSAAQVLPAVVGAALGIPGGLALFAALGGGGDGVSTPLWQLLAVVPATVLLVAVLTAIPARISARRPVAEILQSEHA